MRRRAFICPPRSGGRLLARSTRRCPPRPPLAIRHSAYLSPPGWAREHRQTYDRCNRQEGGVRAHPGVAVAEGARSADLRRLLTVVQAARSGRAEDGFPVAVLARAHELVPCDVVSFAEFDPVQRRDYVFQSLPADNDEPDPVFYRHYWDCAPCSYPHRSGDLLSITIISDFYTRRQWHNTGMYADYVGPAGVEAEAIICLSAPATRARRLILYRGP